MAEPKISRVVELYSGTITETTTGEGKEVPLADFCHILVDVTAQSGTNDTLVPTIQVSHDNSEWFDRGVVIDEVTEGSLTRTTAPTTEAKILAAGNYQLMLHGQLAKYMRVVLTVAGTSVSITLSVRAVLR